MARKYYLPLEGITITSLEHSVGAPLCSRLLADMGAEVIKIERRRGGDFGRHWDSAVNGLSSYFVWLNRNKKSITLNLKTKEGKKILERLLKKSDVFVQNLGPGGAQKLGFGPKRVCKKFRSLIYCSVSGYGQSGPYRDEKAYDLLIQGESGLISLTGYENEPAKVGVSIADISSGLYSTIAILCA
ncbi:MAG: CaiB/BaiF CoA transferase family protein, partial [Nitrososphaerales archaeon]